MAEDQNRTLIDKFMLRLPDGLRGRIKAAAESRGRSMNSEIVSVLDREFPEPSTPEDVIRLLGETIANEKAEIIKETVELLATPEGKMQMAFWIDAVRAHNRSKFKDNTFAETDAVYEEGHPIFDVPQERVQAYTKVLKNRGKLAESNSDSPDEPTPSVKTTPGGRAVDLG